MTEPAKCGQAVQLFFHALGLLRSENSLEIEQHLEDGCPACASELHEVRSVMDLLLLAPPPAIPSSSVRERLIAAVEKSARSRQAPATSQIWRSWKESDPQPMNIVRAEDEGWMEIDIPGIRVKRLAVSEVEDRITMLVRMAPGTSYPRHRHAGDEECYVIEGDLQVGKAVLNTGDYQRASGGSIHEVQTTSKGCTLLITSSRSDDLLT